MDRQRCSAQGGPCLIVRNGARLAADGPRAAYNVFPARVGK